MTTRNESKEQGGHWHRTSHNLAHVLENHDKAFPLYFLNPHLYSVHLYSVKYSAQAQPSSFKAHTQTKGEL